MTNTTRSKQVKVSRSRRQPACSGSRGHYHNPMLVLNMSIFNSEAGWETGWNRIFNPNPSHENVWC